MIIDSFETKYNTIQFKSLISLISDFRLFIFISNYQNEYLLIDCYKCVFSAANKYYSFSQIMSYLIDTQFHDALPLMFEIFMVPVLRAVDNVEKYACCSSELESSSRAGVLR